MDDHLNPELRGKYRIKNTHLPRILQTPVGNIHFGTLTEEQAEKLIAADFYYLEKIESPEAGKTESPKVKKTVAAADQQGDDTQAEQEHTAETE